MIVADLIFPHLSVTSKKQALRAIAEETARLYNGNADTLLTAMMERERIGTTGIGMGIAIPHVKLPNIHKMHGVLARLSSPIDYDSIDGKPVDVIFALLAPAESKTTQHLKALAHISRFLKDASNAAAIRMAADDATIRKVVEIWVSDQAAV